MSSRRSHRVVMPHEDFVVYSRYLQQRPVFRGLIRSIALNLCSLRLTHLKALLRITVFCLSPDPLPPRKIDAQKRPSPSTALKPAAASS